MRQEEVLLSELQALLPVELHEAAKYVIALVSALSRGQSLPSNVGEENKDRLRMLGDFLAGRDLTTGSSLISFGEGSQVGDVHVRDIAGQNVITVNIFAPRTVATADTGIIKQNPQSSMYRFDAFVSHSSSEPDKTWVRKTLIPHLDNEGLRICVDYRNFSIGATYIEEIERAVEQSRYTITVLSPSYLASGYTQLEHVLAQHICLEKGQRRLITILFQDCQPGLSLRARMHLDATQETSFGDVVTRIVRELRDSA